MNPGNTNEIDVFLYCSLCMKEWRHGKAYGESPSSYSRLAIGWTPQGMQVWCLRHAANVLHIDFEGHQHPANTTHMPGTILPFGKGTKT